MATPKPPGSPPKKPAVNLEGITKPKISFAAIPPILDEHALIVGWILMGKGVPAITGGIGKAQEQHYITAYAEIMEKDGFGSPPRVGGRDTLHALEYSIAKDRNSVIFQRLGQDGKVAKDGKKAGKFLNAHDVNRICQVYKATEEELARAKTAQDSTMAHAAAERERARNAPASPTQTAEKTMWGLIKENKVEELRAFFENLSPSDIKGLIDKREAYTGPTPLLYAIESGSPEMVTLLLDYNADISYGKSGVFQLIPRGPGIFFPNHAYALALQRRKAATDPAEKEKAEKIVKAMENAIRIYYNKGGKDAESGISPEVLINATKVDALYVEQFLKEQQKPIFKNAHIDEVRRHYRNDGTFSMDRKDYKTDKVDSSAWESCDAVIKKYEPPVLAPRRGEVYASQAAFEEQAKSRKLPKPTDETVRIFKDKISEAEKERPAAAKEKPRFAWLHDKFSAKKPADRSASQPKTRGTPEASKKPPQDPGKRPGR